MDFKFGHTYINPIRIIPNFSLMEDNRRMVFRIPVGNIPENNMEDYIARLSNKFREEAIMNRPATNDPFYDRDFFLPSRVTIPDYPDIVIVDHLSLL